MKCHWLPVNMLFQRHSWQPADIHIALAYELQEKARMASITGQLMSTSVLKNFNRPNQLY